MTCRVIIVLLLAGSMSCGSGSAKRHARYDAYVSAMKGQSTAQLMQSWGPPDETATSKNGNKVMIYRAQREAPISQRNFLTGRKEKVIKEYQCRTSFEIGPDDRILAYEFEGNGCGSRKMNAKE